MAEEKVEQPKPKMNGEPVVIKLRKPVIANGEEVNQLTFKEPTAADIDRVGNPVLIDMMSSDVPKVSFDAKAMTLMMALLAEVPPSTIKQMQTRDWNNAAWTLASFFMPDL